MVLEVLHSHHHLDVGDVGGGMNFVFEKSLQRIGIVADYLKDQIETASDPKREDDARIVLQPSCDL